MSNVKLTQACSNKPEFIAETKMTPDLDLTEIYVTMQNSKSFNNITYLRKAGVLRALCREKSIMLFRNGRITVNCVEDLKEASGFFQFLIETLRLE